MTGKFVARVMNEAAVALSAFAYFCYGESLLQETISMSITQQPNIRLVNAPDYRDTYANSIQIRVSVWDFLLVFGRDRKSTRLNSSHVEISYAVFCLKKT